MCITSMTHRTEPAVVLCEGAGGAPGGRRDGGLQPPGLHILCGAARAADHAQGLHGRRDAVRRERGRDRDPEPDGLRFDSEDY